ncbi:MAG: polysaccharide deacetylase family protein [Pseudomonadota bacterium]
MDAYLERFAEIPVLLYRRVSAKPLLNSKLKLYITTANLERQLKNVLRRGYTPVTFRELAGGLRPKKPILLTFDGGYDDNHRNLLYLLQQYRIKAVVFVTGDRAVTKNAWEMLEGEPEARLMSNAQLKECHTSGLVEIGSQCMSYTHLPRIAPEELADQMARSKHNIEDVIGAEVLTVSYPYGDYGNREVSAAQAAGYTFAVGGAGGPKKFASDPYRIRRIAIAPTETRWQFFKKTSGFYLRYCDFRGIDE